MAIFTSSLAAFLLATSPTVAQPALSQQDNKDSECALVFALVLGSLEEDADAETRMGLSTVVGYFVGKLRGRNADFNLEAAWSPEFVNSVAERFDELRMTCATEAQEMGNDMQVVGAKLESIGN